MDILRCVALCGLCALLALSGCSALPRDDSPKACCAHGIELYGTIDIGVGRTSVRRE